MLGDFISQTRGLPFVWGETDCALWCASALERVTGIDPAADLRGSYSTWFECRQIIMQAGGLVSLIDTLLHDMPLIPYEMQAEGVGVIRASKVKSCAILIGGRALLKTDGGCQIQDDFTLLRGWSWLPR